MDEKLQQLVLRNREEIFELWLKEMESTGENEYMKTISSDLLQTTNKQFVEVIFSSAEHRGMNKDLDQFSERLINLGWPLSYLTEGMQAFRKVTINYIFGQSESLDTEYITRVLNKVDEWVDPIVNQLVNEYSGSWENIVSLQKIALQELSAPLIPVMDTITVMPLIGTIDTERAKLIMENLLDGVIKHNAEVVLIDITGVPVVDTMVAHHIIQAAEAVRLIGAKAILVGIRPEIAQTIVNLGIDLTKFETKSSLRKGFKMALNLTGRKIVDLKQTTEEIEDIINSIDKE